MLRIGVLLTVALALSGCSMVDDATGDSEADATIGDVLVAGPFVVEGRHTAVVVPGIRYDFTISRPTDEIDASSADDADVDREAEDGSAFVGIEWSIAPQGGDAFVMELRGDVEPVMTLVADGRRYELADPLDADTDSFYAVVPDDVDDVALEVEYDGLTQTVADVYSPIEGSDGPRMLYDNPPHYSEPDCPSTVFTGRSDPMHVTPVDCRVQSSGPVPYHSAVGWAPSGRAWVVVEVTVDGVLGGYNAADGEYVEYLVEGDDVRLTLDGRKPEKLLPAEDETELVDDTGAWHGRAVFAIGDIDRPGRLQVRRAYVAVPEESDEAEASGAPGQVRWVYRASPYLG